MSPRIAFFGTPAFSATVFDAIADQVVLVVTQPDRPAGRGNVLQASPVKVRALARGIPVLQPRRIRGDAAFHASLVAARPDLLVVASFGQILPQESLDVPAWFPLNVHPSLLPAYRGATPISTPILDGMTETGVSYMRMDAGLDTGDLIRVAETPRLAIAPDDTTGTLTAKLATLTAATLPEVLRLIAAAPDAVRFEVQGEPTTPVTRVLKKSDGLLDAMSRAVDLERRVRAMDPWPGAFVSWNGQPLRVWRASVAAGSGVPGSIIAHDGGAALVTSEDLLMLHEVQAPGKKRMGTTEFLRGAREFIGASVST